MFQDKNNSEQEEYVLALKRKNNGYTNNNFHNCSIILKKLIKMRDKGYSIVEPHFTNQDNINILAYAYGDKEQIGRLLKDIKEIDEIEKAEAKPL